MPVPKKKKSKSRIGMRRSHDRLFPVSLITCPNAECGEMMMPHRVCPRCGQYKGKKVFDLKD